MDGRVRSYSGLVRQVLSHAPQLLTTWVRIPVRPFFYPNIGMERLFVRSDILHA